jgi:demethylmenaquinone methyltransferase / 2-methoxy-6-polyprenyl-1,4-benzoquinol methylase
MYSQTQPESIQKLFSSIAPSYERMNTLMSLGMHTLWNRALVKQIKQAPTLLDLCAGTGVISRGYLRKNRTGHATLLDFCGEMLQEAPKKMPLWKSRMQTVVADAHTLPFGDGLFDAISVAYGIRNLKNPPQCFQEVSRVLKKGGTFAILELTRPTLFPFNVLHKIYTFTLLPLLGRLFAKNKEAYRYLAKSVEQFDPPQKWIDALEKEGFKLKKKKALMGGIATLIVVEK